MMEEESVLLDFCKAERAIGLGCRAEHNHTVDVGLKLHMNNHRLTGLAIPLEEEDALSKGYADNTYCRPVLLWVNQAPEEAFAAQTVGVAAEGFRFLMVIAGFGADSGSYGSAFCPMGLEGQSLIRHQGTTAARNFGADSEGVHFEEGYLENTPDNCCAVPLRIYGL